MRRTDVELLREYYHSSSGKVQLNDRMKVIHEIIQKIWTMMSEGAQNAEIVDVITKDYKLSKPMVWHRIQDAIALYGDVRRSNKEGMRYVLYDLALRTYQMAEKKNDVKAMNLAVINMKDILGINRDDYNMPNWKALEPSTYAIVLDPATEKAMLNMLQGGGKLNLSDLLPAENIEYVETTNEDAPDKA